VFQERDACFGDVVWCRLSGKVNTTEQNPSWEDSGFSKCLRNETWLFSTMFIIAHLLTLFCAWWIHYSPSHPTSVWSIFVLSSHLRLSLPNGLFHYSLPTPCTYFSSSHTRYMILYYIFIYCNWVSTRWQRSVGLYRNRKGTAIYKRRNYSQNSTKAHITQNRKQSYKQENEHKRVLKQVE